MSRSILERKNSKECYICGNTRMLEEHHVFHGPNRKKSEHYGLKVTLCPYCHRDNKKGVHGNYEIDLELKQIGQRAFEERVGHELFMQEFGKNYL